MKHLRWILLLLILFHATQGFASRVRESLEAYERADLVVWKVFLKGKCSPSAGILNPGGFMHTVFIGSYLGKNFGLVKEISEKGILVKEVFKVGDSWEEREVWMKPRNNRDRPRFN